MRRVPRVYCYCVYMLLVPEEFVDTEVTNYQPCERVEVENIQSSSIFSPALNISLLSSPSSADLQIHGIERILEWGLNTAIEDIRTLETYLDTTNSADQKNFIVQARKQVVFFFFSFQSATICL